MVTASHNPKEYNGYKVYGEDGGQLPIEASDKVLSHIGNIRDLTKVEVMEKAEAMEKGLLKMIGKEVDDEYIRRLKTLSVNPELTEKIGERFKIVYTPLHGAGNKSVRRVLNETGFKNVLVVKEQEEPDPNFPTVKAPNPEEKDTFKLAIDLAKQEDVDLIIGTDPDGDRVGVVVRNKEGDYVILTGNQTGCLLLEYMLSQKKSRRELPNNGFVVKTIVTTELARIIAKAYNIELIEVLTGFKFIGEKIKQLDEFGDKKYLFGFEESCGYLAGTFARDKDAVFASMLIAEMAAYYKSRDMTPYEGLLEIFENYGHTLEGITYFTLEGKEGVEKIKSALSNLRENKTVVFGDYVASAVRDYLKGERYIVKTGGKEELTLPESDVLYYEIKDGCWFCIRPSGTEPKIKIYYGVRGVTMDDAKKELESLQNSVLTIIKKLLFD